MSHDTTVTSKRHTLTTKHKTTIRVDRQLWHEFIDSVQAKDLSTCHVLEALIGAWLYGGAYVPGLGQPLQLNLTMQHIVDRPRRMGFEPTVSDQEWDEWVKEYRERYGYRLEQVGPKRYRITPI